jgi:hypothetical protein
LRMSRNIGAVKSENRPRPATMVSDLSLRWAVWAEVETVTAKLAEPPAVRVRVDGTIEQVAFCGAPEQVSATVPLNPGLPERERL